LTHGNRIINDCFLSSSSSSNSNKVSLFHRATSSKLRFGCLYLSFALKDPKRKTTSRQFEHQHIVCARVKHLLMKVISRCMKCLEPIIDYRLKEVRQSEISQTSFRLIEINSHLDHVVYTHPDGWSHFRFSPPFNMTHQHMDHHLYRNKY